MQQIEHMANQLNYPTISVIQAMPSKPEEFNRNLHFNVGGEAYMIEWWANLAYLHHKDMIVPFEHVSRQGTWPNGAKMNLQFYLGREVCCVIKIEDYPQ